MNPILIALAVPLGAPAPRDATKVEQLVGEWAVVTYIQDGVKNDNEIGGVRFGPDGRAYFRPDAGYDGGEGTYTADATGHPARIDVTPPAGEGGRRVGIFRVDGDVLTVCFREGDDRPKQFESRAGSGVNLVTLKRVRPLD